MILQREIDYFRRGRDGVDVVKYEILPAYVENVRDVVVEDGTVEERLDISLRPPGGKAKSQDLGEQILERLKVSKVLNVGDKSSPDEINDLFPGASKIMFKKAVSGLYRRGLVNPGANSISLI
jgi:predicted RNA-binding protein (virulence factor B family)